VHSSKLEFGDENNRFNTSYGISHPVLHGENNRKTIENTNSLRSKIKI
jgi:hypothetical protein